MSSLECRHVVTERENPLYDREEIGAKIRKFTKPANRNEVSDDYSTEIFSPLPFHGRLKFHGYSFVDVAHRILSRTPPGSVKKDEIKPIENEKGDEIVCVTGAGGFIASWLIKFLLTKGYIVRGAVRTNPADDGWKYEHLRELEGAKERLQLVKADILDYQSLLTVIRGCHGVFHMAAVINDDPEKVIEPAREGTRNVMEACAETGVKRVVFTSSIGAVYMDPHREPLAIVNDDCWSDLDYCIQTKNWYCYAKTLAEKSAWEIAMRRNLELVVINPGLVLGPLLQNAMNPSTAHIMKYLSGSAKTYANLTQLYVDVRDVAKAHILVYETPSARGQRYLCAECNLHRADLVHMLARGCPRCSHPTKCSDEKNPRKQPYKFSNEKLKDVGLSFTPMNQCLADAVASLHNRGFLEH